MKKFFLLIAVLVVAAGCHAQVNANGSENLAGQNWRDAREGEKTPDEQGYEAKAQQRSETKAPTPKAAPPPPPPAQPAAKSAPRRGPPTVAMGVPGQPPAARAALLTGDYVVEEYGPMVRGYEEGSMLTVTNNTDVYQLVSSVGAVRLFRMAGQAHLFVARIDRDSGRKVILLAPHATADFVMDRNACPPNGRRCKVRVQAAAYSTTAPRVKRLPSTRRRTVEFGSRNRGFQIN